MPAYMAPVVDYNIDITHFSGNGFQEGWIVLTTFKGPYPLVIVRRLVANVYAMNPAIFEVVLPQAKRFATLVRVVIATNSDFQDVQLRRSQRRKMGSIK